MNAQLENILRRAGLMMTEYQSPRVYDKGRHADFVTEADIAVQAFLMNELQSAFPGARFFAEEKQNNVLTQDLTFIIDPIDGTTNYFRRRRCSAVSVGAVEGGEPVFGAIYDPYSNAMYHAEKGRGAYCNNERLHVSDVPFEQALIGLGTSPYNEDLARLGGRSLGALLGRVADVRRTGSACIDLCDVACGRSEAYFEWILQPWDYCAATLLVTEAGGLCGNILGGDVVYDRPMPYLGASARVFERLQQTLQMAYQDTMK